MNVEPVAIRYRFFFAMIYGTSKKNVPQWIKKKFYLCLQRFDFFASYI